MLHIRAEPERTRGLFLTWKSHSRKNNKNESCQTTSRWLLRLALSISKLLKQVCISLEKYFPINLLLLLAKDEALEFFAHSGKASLCFIKSRETLSAEERRNVCCLSIGPDCGFHLCVFCCSYFIFIPSGVQITTLDWSFSGKKKEQPPIFLSRTACKHPIYLVFRNCV